MADELITLRESELRERLADAWDEGFEQGDESGEGREWTPNPFKDWCGVRGCGQRQASPGRLLCVSHAQALANLLAAAGLPEPE